MLSVTIRTGELSEVNTSPSKIYNYCGGVCSGAFDCSNSASRVAEIKFVTMTLLEEIMGSNNSISWLSIAGLMTFAIGYWMGRSSVVATMRGNTDLSDKKSEKKSQKKLFTFLPHEESKLVLVIRTDLNMTKGKVAAQCCHATLACYQQLLQKDRALLEAWENTGQTKVTLKCTDEAELLELQRQARALGLCAQSIQDAGRTQIAPGSRTVLGIGPGPVNLINQVTSHLKLF